MNGLQTGCVKPEVTAVSAPGGERVGSSQGIGKIDVNPGGDSSTVGNGQTSGKVIHARDSVNKGVENMKHMPRE